MMNRQTRIRTIILLFGTCFCCVLGSCASFTSRRRNGILVSELKYSQNSIGVRFNGKSGGGPCFFLNETFDLIVKEVTYTNSRRLPPSAAAIVEAIQTVFGAKAQIKIVKLGDEYYSVNNRRLYVYKMLTEKYDDFRLPMGEILDVVIVKRKKVKKAKQNFKSNYGHKFTAKGDCDSIDLDGSEKAVQAIMDAPSKVTIPELLEGPKVKIMSRLDSCELAGSPAAAASAEITPADIAPAKPPTIAPAEATTKSRTPVIQKDQDELILRALGEPIPLRIDSASSTKTSNFCDAPPLPQAKSDKKACKDSDSSSNDDWNTMCYNFI